MFRPELPAKVRAQPQAARPFLRGHCQPPHWRL